MTVVNAQSKSLLAKLLATENITIQRDPSAKTASFDVKNRVLTMPVWMGVSEDLEDMLTVHETGHALDTPSEEWLSAIEKITEKFYGDKKHKASEQVHGFLNVVEDARIDKRQKRRYPGSRRNYIVGYKELIERDFFGTANKDVNTFNFIDRLNMYFKGGIAHGVKFSAEENVFVHRCENTETFEDVVALTEEIFKYCKDRGEENKQQTQKEVEITYGKSKGAGEGEEYDLDDDLEDDFDDMDEGDENEEEQDGDQTEDEDGENQKSSTNAGAVDKEDFVPEAKTEKAWREKQKDLVGNSNIEYVYVTLPKPNMKNIVSGYKSFLKDHKNLASKSAFHLEADWHTTARNNLKTFRNDENATISFMVKEFEMKKSADIFNRIAIAKTGVLDTNKLYSYKYNEDIFRRQSILPNGKNHGFVMFLDWSGSMTNNMRETVKQLISLTSFCKRVQIPFEVYIFRNTNNPYGEDRQNTACFDYKQNNMMFGDFVLRNVLSSQMKIDELNKAYEILWMLPSTGSKTDPMCSTPLNQAIVAAEYVVKDFQSRTKVQIVNTIFLTDGGSDHVDGVSGVDRRIFNAKKRQFIIQDDVMKKDYYLSSNREIYHHEVGREVTNNLLKILKDRTGCNLIGFYLYDRSGASSVVRDFYGYEVDAEFENKTKKFWNENKFIPVTSHGYDDYYIINTYAMKQRVNDLSVDPSMSKAKIAKEFMRFSEKKSVNRILLQRFIDKISSNKKKIA